MTYTLPTPDEVARRRHEATDVGAMARRVLRALAVRAAEGEVEAVEELVALQSVVADALDAGVRGLKANHDYSWAFVAQWTGTTRQGAYQRFGSEESHDCDSFDRTCVRCRVAEVNEAYAIERAGSEEFEAQVVAS